jgi:hypothetical protein
MSDRKTKMYWEQRCLAAENFINSIDKTIKRYAVGHYDDNESSDALIQWLHLKNKDK